MGPIRKHILAMAAPVSAGLIFQVLYVLIDLYFVARLGPDAVAGVGAAATIGFVVMALSRPGFNVEEVWYLSVATVALQAATSLILVYRQMHRARQPALA